MDTEAVLNEITAFADECHGEQKRKYTPDRYIVHPIRVMKMLKERSHDLPLSLVALAADISEQRGGFRFRVCRASNYVVHLTGSSVDRSGDVGKAVEDGVDAVCVEQRRDARAVHDADRFVVAGDGDVQEGTENPDLR